jgi:hypothetical protein
VVSDAANNKAIIVAINLANLCDRMKPDI